MLNRLISFLILGIIFGGIFYFYYYFFVENKGNLTLNGNVSNYEVYLYNEKLNTSFHSKCENKKCELVGIAPFFYEISIKKDGYKDLKTYLNVGKKSSIEVPFKLEKKVSLVEEKKIFDSNKAKINQLKYEKTNFDVFKAFDLGEYGFFYFLDNKDDTLSLYQKNDLGDIKIFDILSDERKEIDLQQVFFDKDYIFISNSKNKYLYNISGGKLIDLDFDKKVNYIKKYGEKFLFSTGNGIYFYDIEKNLFDFEFVLRDFVEIDEENYLGIIYNYEEDKLKKFEINKKDSNVIVIYNKKTKKIKNLGYFQLEIEKILKKDDEIFFIDTGGNYFSLKDYKS